MAITKANRTFAILIANKSKRKLNYFFVCNKIKE